MDELLTRSEAAQRLRISLAKLDKDRSSGCPHPPFLKLGQGRGASIRYPAGELAKWIEDSLVRTGGAR